MEMVAFHTITGFSMLLIVRVGRFVSGAPDTGEVYHICGDKYDVNTGYKESLNYVLTDIVAQTADWGYDYYTTSPNPGNLAYGHGACKGEIQPVDCKACLGVAFPQILDICPTRYGAQLQLRDCRIRYEAYAFVDNE
ncbi:hypothetical protein CDL15_Pgr018471 [Punica granatum]|uniref:Gnk2-homologous domain-containing protein n=1 Tax=Punica granatum TaxID=22663 RepID=A0A218X0N6_PUNGR|nr:hypothetical protein CDL15_Pgr018471 [Punica granatum]PKI78902.1 hypothetical protein CRG98_000706 [Punica granatum]